VLEFDHDQWPRPCAAFSEAPANRLELHVELSSGESVCDVFVEECVDRVEIEVLACRDGAGGQALPMTEIYLRTPLKGRPLIDLCTGATVPGRPR
jgi:hypothetical protein